MVARSLTCVEEVMYCEAVIETGRGSSADGWTFLTNHAHVLLCLAAQPDSRVRDVAMRVGITERAVLRILHDLEEGGYVVRERTGRRTHYRLHLNQPMRHPVERTRFVGELVDALGDAWGEEARAEASRSDAPTPAHTIRP